MKTRKHVGNNVRTLSADYVGQVEDGEHDWMPEIPREFLPATKIMPATEREIVMH